MPQADLAAALGKTQGWVSKMERGLIELDRVGLLNLVAAELHVHPSDLIGARTRAAPPTISGRSRQLRRYDLAPIFDGALRASGELW